MLRVNCTRQITKLIDSVGEVNEEARRLHYVTEIGELNRRMNQVLKDSSNLIKRLIKYEEIEKQITEQ